MGHMANDPSIQIIGVYFTDGGAQTRPGSILRGSAWFHCSLVSMTIRELKRAQRGYCGSQRNRPHWLTNCGLSVTLSL